MAQGLAHRALHAYGRRESNGPRLAVANIFMTLASLPFNRVSRSVPHAAESKPNENVRVQNYLRAVRGEVEPVPLLSRSPPAAEPEVYHNNT